jgi:hypothetical protein
MFSYLQKLLGNQRSQTAQRAARSKSRVRPGLETLEDRLVPTWFAFGNHLYGFADSATDTFKLTAVPNGKPQVSISGNAYTGDMSGISLISFEGLAGGQNTAILTDTTGFANESLLLFGNSGTLIGANYELDMTDMPSIYATGDASAQARLHGSTTLQNTFQATPTWSTMGNSASYDYVTGFGAVYGYNGTANDSANFWGSSTTPMTFGSEPGLSDMSSGAASDVQATGFRWVKAVAGTNADVARLYGSATYQNAYVGGLTDALGRDDDHLTSSVHADEVVGFNVVVAYAGTTSDVAKLYGSTKHANHFVASAQAGAVTLPNSQVNCLGGIMFWQDWGPNPLQEHYDGAGGFEHIYGYNGTAKDIADFRGSLTSQNIFVSSPAMSEMYSGTAFDMQGTGFRWVGALAGTSSDVAVLTGSSSYQNTLTNGVDTAGRMNVSLTSSVHSDGVVGFSTVYAYNGTTSDVAQLGQPNATSGAIKWWWGTTTSGASYWIEASGFN